MARKTSIHHQRAHGDAILERVRSERVPTSLKKPLGAFADAQKKLAEATDAAESARGGRDAALEALGVADAALDAEVSKLADAIVGAGLGTRRQPFAKFSSHAPSALVDLAYAREAREVTALCRAIRRAKAKESGGVMKSVTACERGVALVERAIAGVAKPQAAYTRALTSRDALLPAWTAALARLERHAAVAWEDDPATRKAVFAPPEPVAAPRAPRKKVAPPNGAPGADPAQPA